MESVRSNAFDYLVRAARVMITAERGRDEALPPSILTLNLYGAPVHSRVNPFTTALVIKINAALVPNGSDRMLAPTFAKRSTEILVA